MPIILPYNIVNGQAIDAAPVMANFNTLANGAAKNGANSDITSLTGLTTPLAVSEGGTGDTGSAWTAFTGLTVTSVTGTLTTASAAGAWKKLGKTVFFHFIVTITANGTGATAIQVNNLPWTVPVTQESAGRETQTSGFALTGEFSSNSMLIRKYDVSYPGGTGNVLNICGTLEVN